jgi:hypothetical protein
MVTDNCVPCRGIEEDLLPAIQGLGCAAVVNYDVERKRADELFRWAKALPIFPTLIVSEVQDGKTLVQAFTGADKVRAWVKSKTVSP